MRLRIGSYPRAVRSFCAKRKCAEFAEIVHAVIPNMVNKLFLTYGTPLMQQQIFKNRRLFSGERQRPFLLLVSKETPPQFRTTSFCVNCRLVRLR